MSSPILAFGIPGGPEMIIIFLVLLLLFGAKKLPELARGIGRSLGEFRKAKDDFESEIQMGETETERERERRREEALRKKYEAERQEAEAENAEEGDDGEGGEEPAGATAGGDDETSATKD